MAAGQLRKKAISDLAVSVPAHLQDRKVSNIHFSGRSRQQKTGVLETQKSLILLKAPDIFHPLIQPRFTSEIGTPTDIRSKA